jgi:Fic family protein
MQKLFEECSHSSSNYSPIHRAAALHWGIVKIHPFDDGNGRVAPLVVLHVLLNNGYDDAMCRKLEEYFENNRKAYDEALDDSQSTYNGFGNVSQKWYDYMYNALESVSKNSKSSH